MVCLTNELVTFNILTDTCIYSVWKWYDKPTSSMLLAATMIYSFYLLLLYMDNTLLTKMKYSLYEIIILIYFTLFYADIPIFHYQPDH